MYCQVLHHFIRRNPLDRDLIVGQLMNRCKRFIENILEDADLQTVATASLAIFDQMRDIARAGIVSCRNCLS
jgi:hypothetical protein